MVFISLLTTNFNPRPPWGGRHLSADYMLGIIDISIHALRGEGDLSLKYVFDKFNISIHALRGEGDVSLQLSEDS